MLAALALTQAATVLAASHEETTLQGATLDQPRYATSAFWTGERAFILGGVPEPDRPNPVLGYDPTSDTVAEREGALPDGLRWTSTAWTGTHAYVFGGLRTTGTIDDTVYRYHPPSDAMTLLDTRLPTERLGTSAVWTGDHAYVFGGRVANPIELDEILRFDPDTGTITTMGARLPLAVYKSAAAWTGEHAYVFGGYSSVQEWQDTIVRYVPATDTVETMDARLPVPVEGLSAVWNGERIYLFGGYEGTTTHDTVLAYDPVGDSIVELGATLPTTRHGTSAVWTPLGAYVFAGTSGLAGSAGALDEVVRFLPSQPPVAAFEPMVSTRTVTVTAASAHDPDGGPLAYRWTWGDGSAASTGAEAEHTYASGGTYAITLVVTDRTGLADQHTVPVTISAPVGPLASFSATVEGLRVDVDAGASTAGDHPLTSFAWDWGDGSAAGAGESASHTYAAPGTYALTLTVTDGAGLTDTTSREVLATAADGPDEEVEPPENRPPTAAFTTSVDGGVVVANASGSSDADGTITSFEWDWGDDTAATLGVRATHTYAEPGRYIVTLLVVDDRGASASLALAVDIEGPNGRPVPSFELDSDGPRVRVNASSSTDPDGTVVGFSWDWGDGSTTTDARNATHTYLTPGTYEITLTVTDDDGAASSMVRPIVVASTTSPDETRNVTVDQGRAGSDPAAEEALAASADQGGLANASGTNDAPADAEPAADTPLIPVAALLGGLAGAAAITARHRVG